MQIVVEALVYAGLVDAATNTTPKLTANAIRKAAAIAGWAAEDSELLLGHLKGSGKSVLVEPQALHTEVAKLPGLDGAKMSKSYGNAVLMRDDARIWHTTDRAELAGLERLLGKSAAPELSPEAALDALNAELCAGIRSGALDPRRKEVLAQVKETVRAKLLIANPEYPALQE